MIRRALIALAAVILTPFGLTCAQASAQSSAKQKEIGEIRQMALAGDIRSQVELGLIYATGDGVAKDDAEAVTWFRKGADENNPIAERYLAEMYFKGRGVPADNLEAVKWLRMAAEQDDAQSEHNLAVMYTQGLGVARNLKEAAKWMQKSAEQGLVDGEVDLGVFYENGTGLPVDQVAAAKWYRKALEQDSPAAMNNLALLLATSRNPNLRNPQEAVALATKALAAVNSPVYMDTLATAYFAAGQTQKAVETEQKALARDPNNESYQESLQRYLATPP